MPKMLQTNLSLEVKIEKEINGVAMGVLSDGTPYLHGRGVAQMCGVHASAIIQQEDAWAAGPGRDNKLGKLIIDKYGYTDRLLYVQTRRDDGRTVHAYTDKVAMAMLEHYAFHAGRYITETARDRLILLAGKTLRDFIYGQVGYSPAPPAPDDWDHIHNRILLNPPPAGYFTVLTEGTPFLIPLSRPARSHAPKRRNSDTAVSGYA